MVAVLKIHAAVNVILLYERLIIFYYRIYTTAVEFSVAYFRYRAQVPMEHASCLDSLTNPNSSLVYMRLTIGGGR